MTWKTVIKRLNIEQVFYDLLKEEGYNLLEKKDSGWPRYEIWGNNNSLLHVNLIEGISAAWFDGKSIKTLGMDEVVTVLTPTIKEEFTPHGKVEGSIKQEEMKRISIEAVKSIWSKLKTKGKPTKHDGLIDFGFYHDLVHGTDNWVELR